MDELETTRTESNWEGRRVAFLGKLGGLTRREAAQLVRSLGGTVTDQAEQAQWLVLGADELPVAEGDEILTPAIRALAARGDLRVLTESEFLDATGQGADPAAMQRRLYTPAMLAGLLKVPVSTIRRWARRGLIVPVYEVRRLPYFDFQQVATARRLAQLIASGRKPDAIERQLEELARLGPDMNRPLAQLHVIVEGKRILLRQGEGLIDMGGQRWLDFESVEASSDSDEAPQPATIALPQTMPPDEAPRTASQLVELANTYEDEQQWSPAAEAYRAALAAGGPDAAINFQLAEVLYRLGDLSAARERYFVAIELDEDFVEARANLGCVLAELGQFDLAIAAFQGALAYHDEYADVHYHLARLYDDRGDEDTAREHWERFLSLAPDSPWADEARGRLGG